jgi:CheY-like chemotaxis protein
MLRIALVDDNDLDARLLTMAMERVGQPLKITHFDDGARALERIGKDAGEFDLVLLDLNLPGLSGAQVLEQLRKGEASRSLPVIMISSSNDPADIQRCYSLGANSYVCKPVHLAEVFETTTQLVTYWSKCAVIPHQVHAGIASKML